jgi:O-antigen/teichoic acid export membrane protein
MMTRQWRHGGVRRVAVILFILGFGTYFVLFFLAFDFKIPGTEYISKAIIVAFFVAMVSMIYLSVTNSLERQREVARKLDEVEQLARLNPEKPQFAWDLARVKLENYLDRNLGQQRSIFWLTFLVMLAGFVIVVMGLLHAYDQPDNFSVSIVASASGVIISFIGGSFLIIYRSVLSASASYISVLERINAVGMAVNVLSSIGDEDKKLKHDTTAEIAKRLLELYSVRQK